MTSVDYSSGALGKRTLQIILELKDKIGKQIVHNGFQLSGLNALPYNTADRIPTTTYRRSRNRGGYYVEHEIYVMEMDDGSFLYYHPYYKIQKLNTVTWTGSGNASLLIPTNVKQVFVLSIHRNSNTKASPMDFHFSVSLFKNVNYCNNNLGL